MPSKKKKEAPASRNPEETPEHHPEKHGEHEASRSLNKMVASRALDGVSVEQIVDGLSNANICEPHKKASGWWIRAKDGPNVEAELDRLEEVHAAGAEAGRQQALDELLAKNPDELKAEKADGKPDEADSDNSEDDGDEDEAYDDDEESDEDDED